METKFKSYETQNMWVRNADKHNGMKGGCIVQFETQEIPR